jgi:hypothetical protein
LIERLRGAARATLPRSQKAILEIGSSVMEPLLILLETYRHNPFLIQFFPCACCVIKVVFLRNAVVVVWAGAVFATCME